MEQQIGVTLNRILADAGYCGHNALSAYRFKVYTAGQSGA
jgi:transposase, IS5 family